MFIKGRKQSANKAKRRAEHTALAMRWQHSGGSARDSIRSLVESGMPYSGFQQVSSIRKPTKGVRK